MNRNRKNKIIKRFIPAAIVLLSIQVAPAFLGAASAPATVSSGNVLVEGIAAESRQRWADALVIYRRALDRDPAQIELWLRIADIEAYLANKEKAAEALARAAQLQPHNPGIQYKLSQAYALSNQPKEALAAIDAAMAADPDNIAYLKARAQLANWLGKPKIAADSYYRLTRLLPHEDEFLLWLARADSWSGKLDRAAAAYKKYLAQESRESRESRPGYLEVLEEYIKVQTWRGNFSGALKLAEMYREKGGDDKKYRQRKADILCRASRPRAGLKEVEPLLLENPADYEMQTARTIAFHYDDRPGEAMDNMEILEQMRPQSFDTVDLRKFIWTPQRHGIPARAQYYSDSIGIDIFSAYLAGNVRLSPGIHLKGGYEHNYLKAPLESGFNNIDGSEDARCDRQWVGADLQLDRGLKINGLAGSEKAEDLPAAFTYAMEARLTLSDSFYFTMGRDLGYFLISPRAVSLGIQVTANQLNFHWQPGLRSVLPLHLQYETLSDGNSRWEVRLAPRYVYKRTSRLNLDLGASAWIFGYRNEPAANGYWSPRLFQSYMGIVYGYWKLGDNSGFDFRGEAGMLKSDDMDRFRFGWSVDVQGVFGIYRALLLKVRGTYLHNSFRENRFFSAYLFSISLVKRF